jgi:hypothetical protein
VQVINPDSAASNAYAFNIEAPPPGQSHQAC